MKTIISVFAFCAFTYSFSQIEVIDEFYENGAKYVKEKGVDEEGFFIERTLIDGAISFEIKSKTESPDESTKITTVITNGVERVYYEKNGVEVGVYMDIEKNYGKYYKFNVSIVNNTPDRIDFVPDFSSLRTEVRGRKITNQGRLRLLSYDNYMKIVQGRQLGNAILAGVGTGLANISAGYTTVSSNTTYKSSYGSGYISSSTTFYSPTLARLEREQNMEMLANYADAESGRLNLIELGYLRANTLREGEMLESYVYMPYDKNVELVKLLLKVGGQDYEFIFNTEGLK